MIRRPLCPMFVARSISFRTSLTLSLLTAEHGHRRVPLGANSIPSKYRDDCHKEYLKVKPKRPVVDVPNVVLELLFPRDRISSVYLRPTGNPGTHFMATRLFGRV